MTFHTLEDKFNAMSKDIYGRFTNPGQIDTPIRPDASNAGLDIQNDSRTLPLVSTARDAKLVGKFLTTGKGLLFLGKQGFLQTGNTFAETRLYNPTSPLLNTVPFLHANRQVSPTKDNRGALQPGTIANLKTSPNTITRIRSGIANALHSPFGALSTEPKMVQGFYERPEDVEFKDDTGVIRYNKEQLKLLGKPKKPASTGTGVELSTGTEATFVKTYDTYKAFTFAHLPTTNGHIGSAETNGYLETSKQFDVIKYKNSNADLAATKYNGGMIGDSYNTGLFMPDAQQLIKIDEGQLFYDSITRERNEQTDIKKTDIIKFIFESVEATAAEGKSVYFRAFISSIKQNVKPEFNSQRYVGRNERFVTYGGATRTLSLSFNIVAFSRNELDNMWLRVNYLTGLAFPKSVSDSGFMTPPLFKLTVGGLYDRQPCYIESLDFDFLDELITFDIDSEVPQFINVTMTLSLLEKRSKFHDSPFYAITEKWLKNNGTQAAQAAFKSLGNRRGTAKVSLPTPAVGAPPPSTSPLVSYSTTPRESVAAPAPAQTSNVTTETAQPSVVPAQSTAPQVSRRRADSSAAAPPLPQLPPAPTPSNVTINSEGICTAVVTSRDPGLASQRAIRALSGTPGCEARGTGPGGGAYITVSQAVSADGIWTVTMKNR